MQQPPDQPSARNEKSQVTCEVTPDGFVQLRIAGNLYSSYVDKLRFLTMAWWIGLIAIHVLVLFLAYTEQRIFYYSTYFFLASLVMIGLAMFVYLLWSFRYAEEIILTEDYLLHTKQTKWFSFAMAVPLKDVAELRLQQRTKSWFPLMPPDSLLLVLNKKHYYRRKIRVGLHVGRQELEWIQQQLEGALKERIQPIT